MKRLETAHTDRPARCADAHERGLALLDMVRTLVASARLVPDPLCYRVLWAYLTEEDAALVRAVDRHLVDGTLDHDAIAGLAAEHLGAIGEAELGRLVEQASDEAREIAGRLDEGAREIAAFDEMLGREDDAFAGGSLSAEAVEASVRRLRRSSARVLASHRRIAVALEESSRRVGALAERLEEAERQANDDHLTGVLSRRGLAGELKTALDAARASPPGPQGAPSRPIAAACCDLDRFRRVNEQWGAAIGDQLLRFVARFLESHFGESVLVGRWSGASFMIVFPGVALAEAERRVERARVELGRQVVRRTSDGAALGRIGFTAAVGEVQSFETADSFLERLELSVLAAKREGRDRVVPASLTPPAALSATA